MGSSASGRGARLVRVMTIAAIFHVSMAIAALGDPVRYYVDDSVGASGAGTSWGAAFQTIDEAVTAAAAGDEIWVAEGSYSLQSPVTMKNGLKIYGGFANGATALAQQNTTLHPTVISGAALASTPFVFSGITNGRLDGLMIQNADVDTSGGAVACVNLDNTNTIANCTMQNNKSGYYWKIGSTYYQSGSGGAIYCENASPVIQNCRVVQNIAMENGGGIFIRGGNPRISSCTISENGNTTNTYSRVGPFYGGGVCIESATVSLTGSTIIGNQANKSGGGVSIVGDFHVTSVTLENCAINSNDAVYYGGGIYCWHNGPLISSCTINGNLAHMTTSGGGGIALDGSSPLIVNCMIAGNEVLSSDYAGTGAGGALWCTTLSCPTINYCSIIENIAYKGAVAYTVSSGGAMFNACVMTKGGYNGVYDDTMSYGSTFSDCLFSEMGLFSSMTNQHFTGSQILAAPYVHDSYVGAPYFTSGPMGRFNTAAQKIATNNSRVYHYLITDAYANYAPGELAGKTILVRRRNVGYPMNYEKHNYAQVLDNTTTTILIVTPASGIDALLDYNSPPGGCYQVVESRLGFGSPGIDQAWNASNTTTDRDGHTRPVDIPCQGGDNGYSAYDICAYETQGNEPADVEITTSTCPLEFGEVHPVIGKNMTISIANRGFSTLTFTGAGLAIGGADAADFSIVGAIDATPLAPGQTRSITLRFNPTTTGTRSAELRIMTNDPAKPTLRYPLSGTGIYAPIVNVWLGQTQLVSELSVVDYGTCLKGRTATRTFTVRNDGEVAVTFTEVYAPTGFTITEPLKTTLAAGESDTFTVAMSTAAPAAYSDAIFIYWVNYVNTFVIGVTGTILEDTSAPSVGLTSSVGSTTNQNRIPVTVTFSEDVTGFTAGDVSLINCTLSEFAGSGASYSFVLTPLAPGIVSASIGAGAALDLAGNPNTAGSISRTYEEALDPNLVWVSFSASGTELGTPAHPFNTVGEAVAAASAGGTIRVLTGQSSERLRITKAVRIEASGGAARIGN